MDKDDQLILEAYQKSLLSEGNVLQQRFNKWLSKGITIGMISPETSQYSGELRISDDEDKNKANAKLKIKDDLRDAVSSGLIGGWSGPNTGIYQPEPDSDVYPEESYIVHAIDSSKEKTDAMIQTLKSIGKKYGQESIMVVLPNGSSYWLYLRDAYDYDTNEVKHKKGSIVGKGKLHYNVPLHARQDIQGRTELVKSKPSKDGGFPRAERSATAFRGKLTD